MKDLTPILSIIFAVGISVIVIVVWKIRNRRSDEAERVRHAARVEEGIHSGALTPDGVRACRICGSPATEYAPISAASWMDKLPLLNRLFSLPPRYVIVDDVPNDFCVCLRHKDVAVKTQEEFHALLRAELARFNAAQAEKVAQMDSGGLFQIVEDQHRAARRSLRATATPMPQLEAKNPEPSVTLVTTSGPDKAADGS